MTKRKVFFKRATSLLLVVVLLTGLFPVSALSVDTDTETSISSASENSPDYDMNDPDMEMGHWKTAPTSCIRRRFRYAVNRRVLCAQEVLDQIEKLEEELSQPEEPEYVWDDGSLVVDLNLPNDKTWVMIQQVPLQVLLTRKMSPLHRRWLA